jgi:hypothetical protein
MDVTQTLKDSAYVAVGLSVLGFQRAQVARRELASTVGVDRDRLEASLKAQVEDLTIVLDAQLSEVRTQVHKAVANLEEALEPVAKELEVRFDDVEQRLPDHVKAVVASARQAAETAATQVRSLLAA